MTRIEELKQFLNGKDYVTTSEIVSFGLDRVIIKKAIENGILFKIKNGLYSTDLNIEDPFLIIQKGNNVIFSNETALYLNGLSDRTPIKYSITVLQGSSSNLLKKHNNIKKYYVSKKYFNLGTIDLITPYGNVVKTYNIDRTIVDIIKNESRIDRQVYLQAINYYMQSKNKNISAALNYASKFKCFKKVKNILSLFGEI